jgi:signal transduction histidine kinase
MHQPLPEQLGGGTLDAVGRVTFGSGERAHDDPWWPARSQAAFMSLGIALAIVLTGIGLALALTTRHLEHPGANALVRPYLIASPIIIGLFWKARRPENRFGSLLVLTGCLFFPLSWQASNDPLIHTVGVVLGDTLGLLATFFLALAFPVGRLQGRADRIAMGLITTAMVALVISAIGRPALQGGGPLSRCGEACPPNPIQLVLPSQLLEVAAVIESVALLGATLLVIAIIVERIVRARRPRRRALVAVAVTSLLFFPVFFTYQLIRRTAGVDAPILEPLGWVNIGVRLTFALGFVVALVQADVFAASALRKLLGRLTDRPTPQEWQGAVAESLDDPDLRLGFWDPVRRGYRQHDGGELREPTDGDRAWVTVERHGSPVAAYIVDDTLRTDPELLEAVADATQLAVENGALEGELRSTRRAAVEAGDTARQRIAQDLHDSAQQRLIALRIHLELTRERMRHPDEQAMLAELGSEVDDALGDIRAVSRGTHTDELRRTGLVLGLEGAVRSIAVPVRLSATNVGRYAPDLEQAVYFTVLEALQNVAKHAGPDVTADVTMTANGDELVFMIEDDGVGFDPRATHGVGLANMAARVGAVGGRLRVESAPGSGTEVIGRVPT